MKEIISDKDQFYIQVNASLAEEQSRVLKYGEMFAIFNHNGDMRPLGFENQGIYFEGTRFLSRLVMNIEEKHPLSLSSSVKEDNDFLVVDLTNPDIEGTDRASIKKGTVHFFKSIFLSEQFCYERIRVVNYGLDAVEFHFSFEFDADYLDIFEVRGLKRESRGYLQEPVVGEDNVILSYRGLDGIIRKTCLQFLPKPVYIDSHYARFLIKLAPHEQTDFFLTISCQSAEKARTQETYDNACTQMRKRFHGLRADRCTVETSNEQFNDWLNRSSADLFMMLTQNPDGLYPYAGIPWFSTVFGRDGIITALETLWIYPRIARGVLTYLTAHQAKELVPGQDAEPGKIVHEERSGEMANLGEIPFGRYYGSVDSTLLFLILAGYYFERTADKALIEKIWPSIELALTWVEKYGDADKDGFVEYERKSIGGLSQQGWKDSGDSVFHKTGELAEPPIALCEVQGYVYEANMQISKLAAVLGKKDVSEKLAACAKILQKKFLEKFWCKDIGSYALALDKDKKPCRVLSSNAGHCLFSGIAAAEHAERISKRFLEDDFFSGWGIRTVASSESRYNPMSYHNGSIWPHDNALIAYGMSRYGYKDATVRILTGLFNASLFVDLHRLPELFCGFVRRPDEGPTLYPVACNPQAWASASAFMLLQACLGLSIDAINQRVCFTNPALPSYLREVRIYNLKVGSARLDMHIKYHPEDVGINIVNRQGRVEVVVIK